MDSRPDTHEHIAQVRGLLLGGACDLIERSHRHDRSKLAEPELSIFNKYTAQLRTLEYGSDEYEAARNAMGEALDHHYAENDHHPEHFEGGIGEMDLLQLLELLADWIAASRRHEDGDVAKSIEINAERFGYGSEISRLLSNTLPHLLQLELRADEVVLGATPPDPL